MTSKLPQKFLLNRSDAIGDNILTMPMLAAIKEFYPDSQVAMLISPRCLELYHNHPFVDEVYTIDKKKNFFSRLIDLWRIFSRFSPDHYLFVGGDQLASLVALFKGVPSRGGLISKWQSFLTLNKGVRQKRSVVAMHEAEYNLELLRPFGIEYHYTQKSQYAPQINVDSEEVKICYEEFLKDCESHGKSTQGELLFIHPGMTGHTLNWSSRNYGRLIERMERNFPGRYIYVISFTPSDEPYLTGLRDHLESLKKHLPFERIVFLDGSAKGLRHYIHLLSKASLFIGPSTGTTHIANTLGVKTVALYSPIKVQSAMRWGPFKRDSNKLEILVPDVVCGESFECAGQSCPYYECMAKIEVEDVIRAAAQLNPQRSNTGVTHDQSHQ